MENTRELFKQTLETKIGELRAVLVTLEGKLSEAKEIEANGIKSVNALIEQKETAQAGLDLATDLTTAKQLFAQVEQLEKDIELQKAINNGQLVKFKEELETVFKSFFAAHAEAKKAFKEMDKEYLETLSIRSAKEDVAVVNGFARDINFMFAEAKRELISNGFVSQGTPMYNGYHLGQADLHSECLHFKNVISSWIKYV